MYEHKKFWTVVWIGSFIAGLAIGGIAGHAIKQHLAARSNDVNYVIQTEMK